MDKVRGGVFFLCVLALVFFSVTNTMGDDEEQRKMSSFWEWQKLRNAYSNYSALFSASIGQYWHIVKALVNQAYMRFFPPNIDFRRGDKAQAVTDNGAGERVKEAISKSLGTSKATVEDTAESAANLAGETMQKAKEKVKRRFSGDRKRENQNEL